MATSCCSWAVKKFLLALGKVATKYFNCRKLWKYLFPEKFKNDCQSKFMSSMKWSEFKIPIISIKNWAILKFTFNDGGPAWSAEMRFASSLPASHITFSRSVVIDGFETVGLTASAGAYPVVGLNGGPSVSDTEGGSRHLTCYCTDSAMSSAWSEVVRNDGLARFTMTASASLVTTVSSGMNTSDLV